MMQNSYKRVLILVFVMMMVFSLSLTGCQKDNNQNVNESSNQENNQNDEQNNQDQEDSDKEDNEANENANKENNEEKSDSNTDENENVSEDKTGIDEKNEPEPEPEPELFSAKINFAASTSADVEGYVKDSGLEFSEQNGLKYGWTTLVDEATYGAFTDRTETETKATGVFLTAIGSRETTEGNTWELEVPNGTYTVRIVAGEPWYYTNNFVNIEGVECMKAIIDDGKKLPEFFALYSQGARNIPASMFADETYIVDVLDGNLTVQIPLLDAEKYISCTKLAAIEVDQLKVEEIAKVNFAASTSADVEGYVKDSGLEYSEQNGLTYGWATLVDEATYGAFTDRTETETKATGSFLTAIGSRETTEGNTWEMAVENGVYSVRVVAGEPWYYTNNFVNIEGTECMKAIIDDGKKLPEFFALYSQGARNIPSSMFADETYIVPVNDGKLSLQIPLLDAEKYISCTKLASVEVKKLDVSSITKVNFAASTSADVEGYVKDSGLEYSEQNGLTYGWATLVDEATYGAFTDRTETETKATGVFLTAIGSRETTEGNTWEMAVENGTYAVRVIAGEPWYYTNNYVNIEGIECMKTIIDDGKKLPEFFALYSQGARNIPASMFADQTFVVKVTDSKLSVQIPMLDAEKFISCTKLAGLEIMKLD